MKQELLAFSNIGELFSPLPSYEWPFLWPQLVMSVLLICFGIRVKRFRTTALLSGSMLLLITLARFASILYLGSRIILISWLGASILAFVWLWRQPQPIRAVNDQLPIIIPKKRKRT